MPSQIKLGVFALISTAAAIPHAAHDRFHHRRAAAHDTGAPAPYPTGGWAFPHNSTALLPTGTGTGVSVVPDSKTALLNTQTSTETLLKTVYLTPSPVNPGGAAPSSVGAEDASKGPGAGACGPATVYVTATNKVTVTVPAGGAGAPPAHTPTGPAQGASSVPVVPGGGEQTPSPSFALPSSAAGGEHPSKPIGAPAPKSTSEGGYSILPIPSAVPSVAPPVESSAPVGIPTPTPPAPVSSAAASSAAASSAAPKPSGSPTYSGGKRGLAYTDVSLCSAFGNGKFSWAYNWGQTESASLPEGVKYVPTMHKPSDSTPDKWLDNVSKAVKGGSNMVMGFNEPDHGAQSNLSPEQACTDWKKYMEPIASAHPDVTILGPSVTNGPPPMGLDWLSRFQKACPDATWHGANVHFYDVYDGQTVERFKAQVEKAAANYGKPVYVTEFGLNPGSATPDQAATFLKGCMEYMDASNKVKGYSYFMVGAGENQLNSGNGLSPVGKVYSS